MGTRDPDRPSIGRALVGFVAYLIVGPVALFFCAGTLGWPMAWVYVGMGLVSAVGSRLLAYKRHAQVLLERARYASVRGVQDWDRRLVLIVGIIGPVIIMIVAGLDFRIGLTGAMPLWAHIVGGLLVAGGFGLGAWAMAVNPFFSAVARIQHDRGQHVIRAGPYRYVRHPAHAGFSLDLHPVHRIELRGGPAHHSGR